MTVTVEKPAEPTEPAKVEAPERKRRGRGWLVTLLAVVLALVLGGLLMIFTDSTVQSDLGFFFAAPGYFFGDAWHVVSTAYGAMFSGAIFDIHNNGTVAGILGPISNTLQASEPLICAGLGITLAFRSGLFNIGGEGQIVVGAFLSGYVGLAWHLPVVLHLIVALLAGIIGGAIWGFIAGFLKARAGAHEVITTIMLNYVALYGLRYLISRPGIAQPGNPQASKVIDSNAQIPVFDGNLNFDLGIVLSVAAAAVVWWVMSRSTIGFRLRAVGANPAAARTAGMSVQNTTMQAMMLAGALSGLAGAILLLGGFTSYEITPGISSNYGFDAITVALLGRTTPWGTVGAGLLLGALDAGGRTMQSATAQALAGGGIPIDIVTVIESLIVIFVAAPMLIRALFRLRGQLGGMLTSAVTNLTVTVNTVRKARVPRHVFVGVTQAVLGVLGVVAFGLGSRAGERAILIFTLNQGATGWSFVARPAILLLCLLTVLVGGIRAANLLGARWCASISIFALVTAFMIWASAGSPDGLNIVLLLQGSLFPAAIPLILGAMAGIIGERSGVVNVAIEGQLLLGAFVGAVAATLGGTVWAGVLGGALIGLILGAILAVLAIRYLVDQVIVGVVLDVFALGITNFLYQKLLTTDPQKYNTPAYFHTIRIPGLADIPIIGPVLFDGTIFLYFTYVLVIAVHIGLFHTRWGLRVRAVGEHPKAADTVGIKVRRTRYRAVMLGGVIAGLGGSFLVLGTGASNTFSEDMSSGKGFIALAAVIFGRWTPAGAVAAALLFGFAEQLGNLLSTPTSPIDSNLLLTAPYIATIIAVAGMVGRSRAPAADGQPYTLG